jgi:iron-sulfur cluster repair protein YtfE (RIC family)
MQPSEVRHRILRDHEGLRARLVRVEELARALRNDELRQVGDLREAAETLLSILREHMRWEDRYLVPVLRDADAWGDERAERFEQEHREQRELLSWVVGDLQDQQKPPVVLAAHIQDLVETLRTDMDEEEAFFLDPDVLRDDVVSIDMTTG